ILVLVAASACGGGSGSGSNVSVPSGDVAIVGDRTITVDQLDRQIELRVRAAKIQKQQLPKAGTQAYRQQVVQPLVDRLVFNARAALSTPGAKWQTVAKKYAIPPGPPSTGGKFTATNQPGALEENFRKEVFGDLATGVLSALIPVSDSYQKSSLQGKCKPDCFF